VSELANDDLYEQIGTRIRDARMARKMSLREVGARADVTASFLSQVERNQVQPSIITLRRVCEVLGMSMSEALDAPDGRHSGIAITRADKRGQMVPPTHDVAVDMLVTSPGRPFDLLMVKLGPGMATAPDLVAHDAREAMLVLSGTARFESLSVTADLQAGDTIYLNSSNPHRMVNAGETELIFIDCVVGDI
jgi:transcriptional regulator with XRE-family HTH domain